MVSLLKTLKTSQGSFAYVPVQNLSKPWTDEELYDKYGINSEEQKFISTMVRPLENHANYLKRNFSTKREKIKNLRMVNS